MQYSSICPSASPALAPPPLSEICYSAQTWGSVCLCGLQAVQYFRLRSQCRRAMPWLRRDLACLQSDGKQGSSGPWALGSDKVFPLFLWQSTWQPLCCGIQDKIYSHGITGFRLVPDDSTKKSSEGKQLLENQLLNMVEDVEGEFPKEVKKVLHEERKEKKSSGRRQVAKEGTAIPAFLWFSQLDTTSQAPSAFSVVDLQWVGSWNCRSSGQKQRWFFLCTTITEKIFTDA